MSAALNDVIKVAMDLSPEHRLALAEVLVESATENGVPDIASAWNEEISERIQAIEDGRAKGIPYEEVLQLVEARLMP